MDNIHAFLYVFLRGFSVGTGATFLFLALPSRHRLVLLLNVFLFLPFILYFAPHSFFFVLSFGRIWFFLFLSSFLARNRVKRFLRFPFLFPFCFFSVVTKIPGIPLLPSCFPPCVCVCVMCISYS